jgi:hypothetical protein
VIINEFFRRLLRLPEAHCESCDVLQKQLEISNYEKKQLLEHILDFTKPRAEEVRITKEIDPIKPKAIPFSVRREMLEKEDRVRAEILKQKEAELQSIEALEREVGIVEENNGKR